jgi:hypothetical protein
VFRPSGLHCCRPLELPIRVSFGHLLIFAPATGIVLSSCRTERDLCHCGGGFLARKGAKQNRTGMMGSYTAGKPDNVLTDWTNCLFRIVGEAFLQNGRRVSCPQLKGMTILVFSPDLGPASCPGPPIFGLRLLFHVIAFSETHIE